MFKESIQQSSKAYFISWYSLNIKVTRHLRWSFHRPRLQENLVPEKPQVKINRQTCLEILIRYWSNQTRNTVKPVYNDHPWDPNIVAVVDRWSLFRGHLFYKKSKWDLKSGRCRQVVAIWGWSLAQVWLYCEIRGTFCYVISILFNGW